MSTGDLIRERREAAGWDQERLAIELVKRMKPKRKVEHVRQDISKLETGYLSIGPVWAQRLVAVKELRLTEEELVAPRETPSIRALSARVANLEAALEMLLEQQTDGDGARRP